MARGTAVLAFLAVCAAVWLFLVQFTQEIDSIRYIEWETAALVGADGRERPVALEQLVEPPALEEGEFLRFTTTLPQGLGQGNLVFEVTGAEIRLVCQGEEWYRSAAGQNSGAVGLAQISYPLPAGAQGQLVLEYRPVDGGSGLFPPLLRYEEQEQSQSSAMAYVNLSGIPAGIAALALVLIWAIFLLGAVRGRPDWTLLPLAAAAVGMLLYPIAQSSGYYFLTPGLLRLCTWSGWRVLTLVALLAYLLVNRRLWRYFAAVVLGSAGCLGVTYWVSWVQEGHFARYISSQLAALPEMGLSSSLLYWCNVWLIGACALVSIWSLLQTMLRDQAEAQSLRLKNQLAVESYRLIEEKIQEGAAMRHEMRHQIALLDLLYQKGDLEALGAQLAQMKEANSQLAPIRYTHNFCINTILQSAAAQARQQNTSFQATAMVEEKLPVPEGDLCTLLMNLLDNALEACRKVEGGDRWIRFQAQVNRGILFIQCENSYQGSLRKDGRGRLLTTKEEPELHGFGLRQMETVAKKYEGSLEAGGDAGVFRVKAALYLPGE